MVEIVCHHPSLGHAPKFHEIVFAVSQNEHDFGVLLSYRITIDDDWNRDGCLRSFTVWTEVEPGKPISKVYSPAANF
jgi:hypothetical protein